MGDRSQNAQSDLSSSAQSGPSSSAESGPSSSAQSGPSSSAQSGPSSSGSRLPSFRASRDLSLSRLAAHEKARKIFTPNLNVQRKKHRDEPVSKEPKVEKEPRSRGTRQRPRNTVSLVQASGGVFAEGAAVTKQTHGSGIPRETSGSMERPALKLKKQTVKVDKEEEDAMIKRLLTDDFIEDPDLAPDKRFPPVSLPLSKYSIKPTSVINSTEINSEVTVDTGSANAQSGKKLCELSLLELLNANERQQVLIQLPDRLPCLPSSKPDEKSKTSRPGTSREKSSPEEEEEYCTLQDLPPGHIGELLVRKSGKVEMVLGKCNLTIKPGTPVSFKEELVATRLNSATLRGEAVNLGPVTGRLVCSPDWECFLRDKEDETTN